MGNDGTVALLYLSIFLLHVAYVGVYSSGNQ